jgi:hypothetical protein
VHGGAWFLEVEERRVQSAEPLDHRSPHGWVAHATTRGGTTDTSTVSRLRGHAGRLAGRQRAAVPR